MLASSVPSLDSAASYAFAVISLVFDWRASAAERLGDLLLGLGDRLRRGRRSGSDHERQ